LLIFAVPLPEPNLAGHRSELGRGSSLPPPGRKRYSVDRDGYSPGTKKSAAKRIKRVSNMYLKHVKTYSTMQLLSYFVLAFIMEW
jgi:hypothetical protein